MMGVTPRQPDVTKHLVKNVVVSGLVLSLQVIIDSSIVQERMGASLNSGNLIKYLRKVPDVPSASPHMA